MSFCFFWRATASGERKVSGLDVGKHEHFTVSPGLEHSIGVCGAVEREPASDVTDYGGLFRGQGQAIRNEAREFVEAFHPTHAVVLGDEDGARKELVQVDGRRGPDNSP